MPFVRANLVTGRNGATTKGGSSRPLSDSRDRKKFHELRQQAQVILIGGSTYRNEPYSKASLPIYIATRGHHSETENTKFYSLAPAELIAEAIKDGFEQILIEGGVNFISDLISKKLIDEIHLTRAQDSGDGDFFDFGALTNSYRLFSTEDEDGTIFEVWTPLNQPR